eukprot:g29098.t1
MELIIDFSKQSGGHGTVCIDGAEMQKIKSFKFLGVNTTNNVSWSIYINATVKKAQPHLYFLRRLRKFGMSTMIFTNYFIDAPKKASDPDASQISMTATLPKTARNYRE